MRGKITALVTCVIWGGCIILLLLQLPAYIDSFDSMCDQRNAQLEQVMAEVSK